MFCVCELFYYSRIRYGCKNNWVNLNGFQLIGVIKFIFNHQRSRISWHSKMIFLKRQKKYFPVCVNENRFVCLSFYPNFIYLHFTCSIINYFVPFFTKTNMVILPPVSHLLDNNSYFDGQIPYTEILYKSHSTDGSTNLYINSYIQK